MSKSVSLPQNFKGGFTSNKKNVNIDNFPSSLSKNESVYGRQIAFAAAFLLPVSKLLEVPSLLARFAAGDLLVPALLHFLWQFLVLGVVLYAVFRTEIPLIFRLKKALGKFLPFFSILYAVYYLFAAILPLFDLEKFVYACFFDTEPTVFSFGFFFIFSAFVCTKGVKAIGRCADLCLFLFLIPFIALIVMAIASTDFSNLLPLFGSKFGDTMSAFIYTKPHFSDVILLLPLLCQYQPKKEDAPKIAIGYTFGMVCTLLFLAVFYGIYNSLAPREHYAIAKISQHFPAISVLGRIDFVFIYLLSVVLLFFACLPLQYSVDLFSRSIKKENYRIWISFIFNLALFLLLLFFNKYYDTVYRFISTNLVFIFFVVADMVPLFLIFLPKYNTDNPENIAPSKIQKKEKSTNA